MPCHKNTVPPTKLTILDELGAAVLNNVVGPYRENADINLTCISSGGQPAPKVTWWREHALLDDSYLVLPDGTVKNVLYLEKLSRHDLHSGFSNWYQVSGAAGYVSLHQPSFQLKPNVKR
uniref:Ig-like domain-containing protein n=1 Tax=Anopheles culicifacies TaxID=139723 RepID=A0A182MPM5_9DIPT